MQTKLFAAGLINVNHQPIVMKLPLKSFVWTTLPDPPTHGREKPRGWLTATRPLSTPADGWIYVCAQSRPANFAIFSLVLAAPLSLSRGFFSFLLLTNPLTRETDTLAITLASRTWGGFEQPFSRLFSSFFLFFLWWNVSRSQRTIVFFAVVWIEEKIEWIRDFFYRKRKFHILRFILVKIIVDTSWCDVNRINFTIYM